MNPKAMVSGCVISDRQSLIQACQVMVSERCGEMFVTGSGEQSGRIVGVLRQADIIRSIAGGLHPARTLVGDAMLTPAPTIEEDATFAQISKLLERTGVRRMLVVRHDSKEPEVVGSVEAGELFDLVSNSVGNMEVFKALSVRARLRIAELLSTSSMTVEELSEELGIQPITVRHHLEVLRRNGMVEVDLEKYGRVGRPFSVFTAAKSILRKTGNL